MFPRDLLHWTEVYIKNRDLVHRKLKGMEINPGRIDCDMADGRHSYIIAPDLGKESFDGLSEGRMTLVTLNTRKNLKVVLESWEKAIQNPMLSIIFVNPNTNQKWMIYPSTHNRISERSSLKTGLTTMLESIEEAE